MKIAKFLPVVTLVAVGLLSVSACRAQAQPGSYAGAPVGTGTYFISFRTDGDVLATTKVTLVR